MPLSPERRAHVARVIEAGLATRPALPDDL
jgi:hypothetical protein